MTQGTAHWLCHEGISAARPRVVYKGRPASIVATKVAALKAEGLGATEIAKGLKIGRASVYRLLLGRRGWGRLNESEIATLRDGCWQTRSDAVRVMLPS
jgi:DNA invertase Pin-like site-specific DNA recombinase